MPDKEQPRFQVSWQQLVAGALAAMTSAWLASSLGVSGTIIGAAVGSFSASVATALYMSGLHRGETLVRPVVRRSAGDKTAVIPTDSNQVDETVETTVMDADSGGESPGQDETESPTKPARKPGWFNAAILGGAVVLVGVIGSIGAFEFFSGNPFGNADRPAIGRPWEPPPAQTPPTLPTTSVPTRTPATTPTPTRPTQTPTTGPTTEPTPQPEPSLEVPEEMLE